MMANSLKTIIKHWTIYDQPDNGMMSKCIDL